jgi:hypothetical protein
MPKRWNCRLTFDSQASHQREMRRQQDHDQLLDKLQEHTTILTSMQSKLNEDNVHARQSDTAKTDLASIASSTQAIRSTVVSLKHIGEQVAQFIGSFPAEIREMLRKILHGNFETYHVLLAVQRDIAAKQQPSLNRISYLLMP